MKDFLDKPEVWSFILNSTNTSNFDPRVSLLRAEILRLKHFNPHDFGYLERAEVESQAMQHARIAEDNTGKAEVSLLDELDCVTAVQSKSGMH